MLERSCLELGRRLAIETHDPFPLVGLMWPELLVNGPEARFFEGTPGDVLNPCLRLDWFQRLILLATFDPTIFDIFIKGCTKAGKGAAVTLALNSFFTVQAEIKLIFTSQRYEHAKSVIFGEFIRWRELAMFHDGARQVSGGLSDTTTRYAAVANPLSGEGFSGQHGQNTVFAFDEATSIVQGFYEDATKQAKKIMALANPRTMLGWFHGGFISDDPDRTQIVLGPFGRRLLLTVSGGDCLNVREKRLERPIGPPGGLQIDDRFFEPGELIPDDYFQQVRLLIPNQIDYARFMGIMLHPDKNHRATFGLGKFPTGDPLMQVILPDWIAVQMERFRSGARGAPEAYGVDIAASLDGDETAMAVGGTDGMVRLETWQLSSTMDTVGRILRSAMESDQVDLQAGSTPVVVDINGIGRGVGDMLREKGCWVIDFNGAASAEFDYDRYGNLRAESFGELGRWLDPGEFWGGAPWPVVDDPLLAEELPLHQKVYGTSNPTRFNVTPKKEIKANIGRSPDRADAVVMLFHGIRKLRKFAAWVNRYKAPLIMYPAPKPRSPDNEAATPSQESLPPMTPRQKHAYYGQPNSDPSHPSNQTTDLLEHLRSRYAGGGTVGQADDDEDLFG